MQAALSNGLCTFAFLGIHCYPPYLELLLLLLLLLGLLPLPFPNQLLLLVPLPQELLLLPELLLLLALTDVLKGLGTQRARVDVV